MVKKINLDEAFLVLEENKEVSLLVRDKSLLPNGFKARIKDTKNYGTALRHFLDKYPELEFDMRLPTSSVLPRIAQPEGSVMLGVTYNEIPVIFDFENGIPHLRIHGPAGTGKTGLALTIAHGLARYTPDYRVSVFADREQEYHSLQAYKPGRSNVLNAELLQHSSTEIEDYLFLFNRAEEIKGHVIIVDSEFHQFSQQNKDWLTKLMRIGRSNNVYVVLISQHDGQPDAIRNNTVPITLGSRPGLARLEGVDFQVSIPTLY